MLKFALIGCGRIAKRHSELLGLKQIKGAELAAVCDNVFDKAQKISLEYYFELLYINFYKILFSLYER